MVQFKTVCSAAMPWDSLQNKTSSECTSYRSFEKNENHFEFTLYNRDHVVASKPTLFASIHMQSADFALFPGDQMQAGKTMELFSLARSVAA
jgi:hypothetical protein